MKKIMIFLLVICTLINPVFAAQFEWDNASSKYKYLKDDYTYAKSEWIAYDSNGNGKVEYYYFDENEYLLVNTVTPDGYTVNEEGQWVENGRVKEEYKINKTKSGNTENINPAMTAPKKGEKKVENTEGIDPDMLPPKVIEAMKKAYNYCCIIDGEPLFPYSRKGVKYRLETAGYKKDIRDRAIDEVNLDWKLHALVFAKAYSILKYDKNDIKKLMKIEGFSSDEITYALAHINETTPSKCINPADYYGLTREEKIQKLLESGIPSDKIEEALSFVDSI